MLHIAFKWALEFSKAESLLCLHVVFLLLSAYKSHMLVVSVMKSYKVKNLWIWCTD